MSLRVYILTEWSQSNTTDHLSLQKRHILQQILQPQEIAPADSVWQYAFYTMKCYFSLQFINGS